MIVTSKPPMESPLMDVLFCSKILRRIAMEGSLHTSISWKSAASYPQVSSVFGRPSVRSTAL